MTFNLRTDKNGWIDPAQVRTSHKAFVKAHRRAFNFDLHNGNYYARHYSKAVSGTSEISKEIVSRFAKEVAKERLKGTL